MPSQCMSGTTRRRSSRLPAGAPWPLCFRTFYLQAQRGTTKRFETVLHQIERSFKDHQSWENLAAVCHYLIARDQPRSEERVASIPELALVAPRFAQLTAYSGDTSYTKWYQLRQAAGKQCQTLPLCVPRGLSSKRGSVVVKIANLEAITPCHTTHGGAWDCLST